jgi:hypothetical protein
MNASSGRSTLFFHETQSPLEVNGYSSAFYEQFHPCRDGRKLKGGPSLRGPPASACIRTARCCRRSSPGGSLPSGHVRDKPSAGDGFARLAVEKVQKAIAFRAVWHGERSVRLPRSSVVKANMHILPADSKVFIVLLVVTRQDNLLNAVIRIDLLADADEPFDGDFVFGEACVPVHHLPEKDDGKDADDHRQARRHPNNGVRTHLGIWTP